MGKEEIAKFALLNGFAATAYVGLVALFMTNAERLMPTMPDALGVTMILLLFSTSAAVMAIVVFGRPVVWYLDGRKQEGITLLFATVCMMALIGILVFLATMVVVK